MLPVSICQYINQCSACILLDERQAPEVIIAICYNLRTGNKNCTSYCKARLQTSRHTFMFDEITEGPSRIQMHCIKFSAILGSVLELVITFEMYRNTIEKDKKNIRKKRRKKERNICPFFRGGFLESHLSSY